MNSRFKVLIGLIAIIALICTVSATYTYGPKTWQENDVLIIPKDELKEYTQTGIAPEADVGDEPTEAEPGEEAFQPQVITPPAVESEFKFPIELTRNVYFNPVGVRGGYFGAERKDKITGLIRKHDGIDMTSVISDAKLYAAYDGEIYNAGSLADCGNAIVIKVNHPKVTWFKYCHLSRVASGIKTGSFVGARFDGKRQLVKKGDLVGYQGNTASRDIHLHFGAYKGGTWASRKNNAEAINPILLYPNIKWPTGKRGLVTEITPSSSSTGMASVGDVPRFEVDVLKFIPRKGTTFGDPNRYDDLIAKCAAKYKISPALIKSIIAVESAFNPNAKSKTNYKGLMQIIRDPTTAAPGLAAAYPAAKNKYDENRPLVTSATIYEPEANICGGTLLLRIMFDTTSVSAVRGNAMHTVQAYNRGPGSYGDQIGIHYRTMVNNVYKGVMNRDISNTDFNYVPKASSAQSAVKREVYAYDAASAKADGLQADSASLAKYNAVDGYIVKCAAAYQIDPNFVKAIVRQESSFDANANNPATGGSGFMGVTQNGIDQLNINREQTKITSGVHMTSSNVKEPDAGICAGVEILWHWYHKTDFGKEGVKKVVQKYSNNANIDNAYWTAVSTRYKQFTGADLVDAVFNYAPAAQSTSTPPQGTTTSVTAITNKKIVLFGDSITGIANYESQVKSLCPGFTVITKKRDGRFVREMISSFDTEVKNENPGVVVVLGGANDFGEPAVTPQTILGRLNQVYAKAKAANIKVAAISVMPFKGYSKSPWNTDAQSAKVPQLNDLIKSEVGSNIDFYVDAYTEFNDGNGKLKATYAGSNPDGLHPRGGGVKLGELVANAIPGCTKSNV